jgi:hypothetical protein
MFRVMKHGVRSTDKFLSERDISPGIQISVKTRKVAAAVVTSNLFRKGHRLRLELVE